MKTDVLAYLHTHWDREWYKTFEEYRFRLCDVLNDIFYKLDTNQINSFYMDGQTIAINDYLAIYPDKSDYIKNLIKTKKLFIGPFHVLADELLPTGECLIRNLVIGINEAKKFQANENDFIGYLPDAFGHNAWMPMLLKKANINNALVWRGVKHKNQEFLWQSPDNTTIRTIFLSAGYYQDFFKQKSYTKNLKILLEKLKIKTKNNTPILLPIGADHLACEDKIKAKLKNFNRDNDSFNIKLSSLQEYLRKSKSNTKLEIISGELYDNSNSCLLYGVHSSRIYLKQKNMLLLWKLGKMVEPLYALLSANNITQSKKENIDYAWKLILQNQAHDSICGCSLDSVHKENMNRFDKVEQVCNTLLDNAKYHLANHISKNSICIINLSNFDYSGIVSFYSNKKLPFTCVSKYKQFPIEISQNIHDIPVQENYNYYYEYLVDIENIKQTSLNITDKNALIQTKKQDKKDVKVTENTLENEFIKLSVNTAGEINLLNKMNKKQYNNLLNITDEPDVGDSYSYSCITTKNGKFNESENKPLVAKLSETTIKLNTPLKSILSGKYIINIPSHSKDEYSRSKKLIKHEFYIHFTLYKKSPRIDAKIEYTNYSKDHILKIKFNLPQNITETISEDSFGTIKRKINPDYDFRKLLPIKEFSELKLNSYSMQRFVMAQGLCVITKGLQEYEVFKNNLNITFLRCFGVISKRRLATRAFAAGPPLPTPDGQCLGEQTAEFSLFMTNNEQEAFKQADQYYNPIIAFEGNAKNTSVIPIEFFNLPNGFYIYNIKSSTKDNAFVVRIFNQTNTNNKLKIDNYKNIIEVDLLENPINNKNISKKEINFKPLELKIFHITK